MSDTHTFQKVCEIAPCLVVEQLRLHRVVPRGKAWTDGGREAGSLVLVARWAVCSSLL